MCQVLFGASPWSVGTTWRILKTIGESAGRLSRRWTERVSGTVIVIGEAFNCNLIMCCSDFSKAFKQTLAVKSLHTYTVIVHWDPVRAKPAYMIPLSQTFGGRSTPLNFARYPASCCYALATFAALPVEHCVDDMMGSDRIQTVRSGWTPWRLFADLCVWRVSDAKSPPPAQVLTVLGPENDLRSLPHQQMIIRFTERRLQVLSTTLSAIWRLTECPQVKQLEYEETKACIVHAMGKSGAVNCRAFIRRQRETTLNMHNFARY